MRPRSLARETLTTLGRRRPVIAMAASIAVGVWLAPSYGAGALPPFGAPHAATTAVTLVSPATPDPFPAGGAAVNQVVVIPVRP